MTRATSLQDILTDLRIWEGSRKKEGVWTRIYESKRRRPGKCCNNMFNMWLHTLTHPCATASLRVPATDLLGTGWELDGTSSARRTPDTLPGARADSAQRTAVRCACMLSTEMISLSSNRNPFPSSGVTRKRVRSARVTSDRSRTDGESPTCATSRIGYHRPAACTHSAPQRGPQSESSPNKSAALSTTPRASSVLPCSSPSRSPKP